MKKLTRKELKNTTGSGGGPQSLMILFIHVKMIVMDQ
jgi:hypothetical protein